MKDVHTEYCCRFHGCKYNSKSCTVIHKGTPQAYPCEDCNEEQGREIQEARHPRCGAFPKNPNDNLPCFLRKDHPVGIHRNLNGAFMVTRRHPSDPPSRQVAPATAFEGVKFTLHTEDPVSASLAKAEPFVPTAAQRAAEKKRQQDAMALLRDAVERVHGVGMGSAWGALYLIEAILEQQEKTVKRIQREYLALVEQRTFDVANKDTNHIFMDLRAELDQL